MQIWLLLTCRLPDPHVLKWRASFWIGWVKWWVCRSHFYRPMNGGMVGVAFRLNFNNYNPWYTSSINNLINADKCKWMCFGINLGRTSSRHSEVEERKSRCGWRCFTFTINGILLQGSSFMSGERLYDCFHQATNFGHRWKFLLTWWNCEEGKIL